MQRTARTKWVSVSQSLVLCFRNAFDIAIRQTINPVPSQRRDYRLEQLDLCFVLQMELCITHHIRAQILKQPFNALKQILNLLRCKVERVLKAVSGFTTPFSSSFEDKEVYLLSFGVPAKPGIAKDLIEADDIGRKAGADFIDSLLVVKSVFYSPIKCYKLIKF